MVSASAPVVIDMDPPQTHHYVEVVTLEEEILGHARFTTDTGGYRSMVEHVSRWPRRLCGRPTEPP